MIRETLTLLWRPIRRRLARLRERLSLHIFIDPQTGRAFPYDPGSDTVKLDEDSYAYVAEIKKKLGETRKLDLRYNPFALDEDVDFFGPDELRTPFYDAHDGKISWDEFRVAAGVYMRQQSLRAHEH